MDRPFTQSEFEAYKEGVEDGQEKTRLAVFRFVGDVDEETDREHLYHAFQELVSLLLKKKI